MIISQKETDTLLVKVKHNSQWDHSSFAIINLSVIEPEVLSKWLPTLKSVGALPNFSSLHLDLNAAEFYSNVTFPGIDRNLDDILTENRQWEFVELAVNEPESFSLPENVLSGSTLVLGRQTFCFNDSGKHTNEQFWTVDLPLRVLEVYYLRKTVPDMVDYFNYL